ncbi:MAG TPA: Rhs element Vgr protein, partial [Flavobacteriaceae bacterium]|nr:Rhs element Vgr protein [Flavobacteriaceae bacterium]
KIVCKDEAVKMTVGRKSLTFAKKTDSEIITEILNSYSLEKKITATSNKWPQMVQYYTTDWDFMLSRAEANGFIVSANNGKVFVVNPLEDKTSVLSLSYGESIYQFNGDLNAIDQIGKAKSSSWDYKTQSIVSGESASDYAGAGNISSKKLSEVVGLAEYQLKTPGTLNQDELSNWSKAQIIKSELSKFSGEVTCQGNHLVLPGNFITLKNLGARFNGDHFVSK